MSSGSEFNAWNPGLESDIPSRLHSQITLFRPENALVNYSEAKELANFSGLGVRDLVLLRPERLILHELLIRVTADFSVPDDPTYEVLGINLRSMVSTIYNSYVEPELPRLLAEFEKERDNARIYITQQLHEHVFPQAATVPAQQKESHQDDSISTHSNSSLLSVLSQRIAQLLSGFIPSSKPVKNVANHQSEERAENQAIIHWQQQLTQCDSALEKACLEALLKVVGGIVAHRGRLVADESLVSKLAVNLVCNTYGSAVIAKAILPIVEHAQHSENYRLLPPQSNTVIMNVKGASASGKSTIRPKQRLLAEKLNIPWEDFALISPDYWRKSLIEYESLGADYKYGAMLTGWELEMIDKKLDQYMASKAPAGKMSHLLVDRFRFDSFSLENGRTTDGRLLSRFGEKIFMFFMITPPSETVKRAWKRGLSTGRYKAVDDLLYHNVEAYTGMPALFFSWVNSKDQRVHYEFLDNSVAEGELPKTVAFGWNNSMTILDVKLVLNIDQYRKVNIDAKDPESIFSAADLLDENNLGFVTNCANKIKEVKFADQRTALVYAELLDGKLVWWDHAYIESTAQAYPEIKIALSTLGYKGQSCEEVDPNEHRYIEVSAEQNFTFGRWGA